MTRLPLKCFLIVLFPSPGVLSDPGIKPKSSASPELQANSLLLRYQGSLLFNQSILIFKYNIARLYGLGLCTANITIIIQKIIMQN